MNRIGFLVLTAMIVLNQQALAQNADTAGEKSDGSHKVLMVGPNCDTTGSKVESGSGRTQAVGELSGVLSISTKNNLLQGVIVSDPIEAGSARLNQEQEILLRKWMAEVRKVIFESWQDQSSEQEQCTMRVVFDAKNQYRSPSLISPTMADLPVSSGRFQLLRWLSTLSYPQMPTGLDLNSISFDVTAAVDKNRFPRENALKFGCVAVLQNGKDLTVQSNGGGVRIGSMTSTSVQCAGNCTPEELKNLVNLVEQGKPIRKSGTSNISISGGGSITVGAGGSINVGTRRKD